MTVISPSIPTTYPTPARRVPATGPIWSMVQCWLTLGLLPLLVWPTRWSTFVEGERRELLLLANAWRRRVVGRNAEKLDSIASRLRPKPMLMVISWLVVGFNVAVFGLLLMRSHPAHDLWDLTFGHEDKAHTRIIFLPAHHFPFEPRFSAYAWNRPPQVLTIDVPLLREPEANLYQIWLGTLLLGYICHWYSVRSHAAAVKQLMGWTNNLARQNHFNPIRERVTRLGLNPLWVLITIGFCFHGAWWYIPLALSGAMQRQYITRTSPAIRAALAEQARAGFSQVSTETSRFCAAPRCGAKVPGEAKFCPRCGASL